MAALEFFISPQIDFFLIKSNSLLLYRKINFLRWFGADFCEVGRSLTPCKLTQSDPHQSHLEPIEELNFISTV